MSSGLPWSPADEFAWIGNFENHLSDIIGSNMLLSHPENPLSEKGPMGDSFWDVMRNINDFTMHMQGLGLWSILGPIGPLGPLGSLGYVSFLFIYKKPVLMIYFIFTFKPGWTCWSAWIFS